MMAAYSHTAVRHIDLSLLSPEVDIVELCSSTQVAQRLVHILGVQLQVASMYFQWNPTPVVASKIQHLWWPEVARLFSQGQYHSMGGPKE